VTVRDRPQRNPAFELARLMRNSDFRAFMKNNGYASGTTVVVAYDDERAVEVFARIVAQTDPPVVLAISRPETRWGFVFLTIGLAREGQSDEESDVHGSSTIGMVYDAAAAAANTRTKLTVPNHWVPAKFEVALAGTQNV
jgi:hypothetical protein